MKILLANPRGFCAGVDRAIEIVEKALELVGPPIYVRHEVVHNRFVVDSLREPYFQPAAAIGIGEVDEGMDAGRYTFVLDIPPRFEAAVAEGLTPSLQVEVDATAMSQAGAGARYLESALLAETLELFLRATGFEVVRTERLHPFPESERVGAGAPELPVIVISDPRGRPVWKAAARAGSRSYSKGAPGACRRSCTS